MNSKAARKRAGALWAAEVAERGLREALKDRLRFHGILTVELTAQHTGHSHATIRRRLKQLAADGWAEELMPDRFVATAKTRNLKG